MRSKPNSAVTRRPGLTGRSDLTATARSCSIGSPARSDRRPAPSALPSSSRTAKRGGRSPLMISAGSAAMNDKIDTARVLVRPPIALVLAIIGGIALDRLLPLPWLPSDLPAGWIGWAVFVLGLVLLVWAA